MNKKIIIVRHGESTGNIGARTDSPVTIPLSDKGYVQAREVAELLPEPDAVIISNYIRTGMTAEPFLKKFPHINPEVWHGIRELNLLSAKKNPDTTQEERIAKREVFWQQLDPYFRDDETSESFADFLNRGKETIAKLRDHQAETIVVFSHDIFIQLLNFIHDEKEFVEQNSTTDEGLRNIMRAFREKIGMKQTIPNATPIDISYMVL
jgi:probable phosphoglycerate mutase